MRSTRAADRADFEIEGSWPPPGYLGRYPTSMLEALYTVYWDQLDHAYGVATNIPERIRAIASSRGAKQESAIDDFANDICHQGSAYAATVPCIPFICEIISNPRIPRRHRLISLLLTIAIGLDDDMFHDGTRITEYEIGQERAANEWPASKKRPTFWGPFVWLECYTAVQRTVPKLLTLLHDKNRLVRLHSQYLLAWFPKERRRTLGALRRSMNNADRWDDLANSILCVGLLEWHAAVTRTSRPFVRPLLKHRREQVRYAAAIYLSWHEPSVGAYEIMRELSTRDDFEYSAPLPFNSYDWTGFARDQLARVWGEPAEVG